MKYDKAILRKLSDLGFKRTARWVDGVEYTKILPDRKLTAQIWTDGYRVSRGMKTKYGYRETSIPTEFTSVGELINAVAYEQSAV